VEQDPQRIVEAVLFASSKPLRMAEIEAASQLSDDAIRRAIGKLKKEYDERGSSIEVVKIGIRYSMQLRKPFAGYGMPFAEVEVPKEVLKTAAYIAYNQPVRQSELAESLGSEVYEHVRVLRSAGLISAKKQGQTLLLSTSKRFPEYFGIPSSRKEDIKRWMEEQVSK
jgi:segregation and condensation protein B